MSELLGTCALWVSTRSDPHLSSVTMYNTWLRRYVLTCVGPFVYSIPHLAATLSKRTRRHVHPGSRLPTPLLYHASNELLPPRMLQNEHQGRNKGGKKDKRKEHHRFCFLFLVGPVKDSPVGDQSVARRSCYFDLIHSTFHWYSCCSDDLSHGV